MDDEGRVRDAEEGEDPNDLPAGGAGDKPGGPRGPHRQVRRHRGAGIAVPARTDGEHTDLRRAQARRQPRDLPGPEHGGGARGHLRYHRLPGTNNEPGEDVRRLHARAGRRAAEGHRQEEGQAPAGAARLVRREGDRGRAAGGARRGGLQLHPAIRRVRLQPVARGGLRQGHLPDGVAEAPPPGRMVRRLRIAQEQAGGSREGGLRRRAHGCPPRAPGREPVGPGLRDRGGRGRDPRDGAAVAGGGRDQGTVGGGDTGGPSRTRPVPLVRAPALADRLVGG